MKFCSLFSGSSGNCLFAGSGSTRVLIDAGKNGKQIQNALLEADEIPAELTGILITHEHSDHIAAAGVLSRRYNLPIYANFNTWQAMQTKLGKIAPENRIVFETGSAFTLGELQITAFRTSHDALEPVGFQIDDGREKLCIATDTGIITEDMTNFLSGARLVVLESNHDPGMLETGPYPYPLKKRISGRNGHLSNDDAAAFAAKLVALGTEDLVLAHLSHENNMPMLAHQTASRVFSENGILTGRDVQIEVAPRACAGKIHLL